MSVEPVAAVPDYAARARSVVSAAAWRYLHEGDAGRNEQALGAWHVVPRALADVRGGHTRTTLFGDALDHPLLLAPVAYQRLFHADGEAASAAAAAAQGTRLLVSSLASQPFAAIAQAARAIGGPPPWFQLYWQRTRDATARLLDRALAAGLSIVVFTIDAPVKRVTLALPSTVRAVNLDDVEFRPQTGPGQSEVFDGWMGQAPTWDDVVWLRRRLGDRVLVLKGVLHPDDAERAIASGCDGIVVSNHGHRVLAAAPASVRALERIARRIDRRIPILFDGGVRSGTDAFVALALGACAVLVGRPAMWGLAAEGAVGVARVIRLLRDELEMTMALAGCRQLADITAECLERDPDRVD
jgi:4-hydroxymandelate oxidase